MNYFFKKEKKYSVQFKLLVTIFIVGLIASFFYCIYQYSEKQHTSKELKQTNSLLPPECIAESGFYKDDVWIEFKSSGINTKIYYTTDGNEPTLSSAIYQTPIKITDATPQRNRFSMIPTSPRWKPPVGNVFKGTVIRAIAVDQNNNKSKEMVKTFFIDKEHGAGRYKIPVIALCINEKDFFGYNKGIYVLGKRYTDKDNYIKKNTPLDLPWWEYPSNYHKRGMDTERKAYINFMNATHGTGFENYIGIRIHGNATRAFAQKSLRISFREEYGKEQLCYDLFEEGKPGLFNSFILRNSGNDWDKTMFRDALMQTIMKESKLETQKYRPSIVFFNGEFWGLHNIRERFDQYYLANKYRLNVDSLTILELNGQLVAGEQSNVGSFENLVQFAKSNDLSAVVNYNYVASQIDIFSFIDFMIANIYFCNSDWPNNNVKFWKYDGPKDSTSVKDGRWRWMLYDMDWGMGYNSLSQPSSNLLPKAVSVGTVGVLFGGLIKNEYFLKLFLNRFQWYLNTAFNTSHVVSELEAFQNKLAPYMQEHINRWRVIGSYKEWLQNCEIVKNFSEKRPEFQVEQLNDFFKLTGNLRITLNN